MDEHEDFKLLLMQFIIKQSENTIHLFPEVKRNTFKLHLPGLKLGQIQNIVDDRTDRSTMQPLRKTFNLQDGVSSKVLNTEFSFLGLSRMFNMHIPINDKLRTELRLMSKVIKMKYKSAFPLACANLT